MDGFDSCEAERLRRAELALEERALMIYARQREIVRRKHEADLKALRDQLDELDMENVVYIDPASRRALVRDESGRLAVVDLADLEEVRVKRDLKRVEEKVFEKKVFAAVFLICLGIAGAVLWRAGVNGVAILALGFLSGMFLTAASNRADPKWHKDGE